MARKNSGKAQVATEAAQVETVAETTVEVAGPVVLTVADVLAGKGQAEFAGWERMPVKHPQQVALRSPDGSEFVSWVAYCRCGCGQPVHTLLHKEGYVYTYYTDKGCYANVIKNKSRNTEQQALWEAFQASSSKIWALDREVTLVRVPLKAAAPAPAPVVEAVEAEAVEVEAVEAEAEAPAE